MKGVSIHNFTFTSKEELKLESEIMETFRESIHDTLASRRGESSIPQFLGNFIKKTI